MEDEAFFTALPTDLGKLAMIEARHALSIQGGGALNLMRARAKAKFNRDVHIMAAEILLRFKWMQELPSIIDLQENLSPQKFITTVG